MTPPTAIELAELEGPALFATFRDLCLARMGALDEFNGRGGASGPARAEADAFEAMSWVFGAAVTSRGRATLKDMADAARGAAKAAAVRRQCDVEAARQAGDDQSGGDRPADALPQQ